MYHFEHCRLYIRLTFRKKEEDLSEDVRLILAAVGGIGLLTIVIQMMGMRWEGSRTNLRKVLHFCVILVCAYVIGSINDATPLKWLFFGFTAALHLVVRLQILNISKGKSLGIALFPLAFAILLTIDGLPRSYIVISAIVLAVADPLAGLIGSMYAKAYWRPLKEQKSWLGSAVFFISSVILLIICQRTSWFGTELSLGLVPVILVGLLATMSEMYSWRGSDNLFIPIVTALSMQAISIHGAYDGFMVALIVMVAGYVLVKLRWLNIAGMLAVVMMASWIALMISPIALILPVTFLVLGSLLSRLNKGENSIAKDDSQGRNAHQVFANGGIGMIMAVPYLLTQDHHFLLLYALVFAVAMSDTSSSEIGRRLKGTTWNIGTFSKVAPGESGGVSLIGTLAGAVGALVIASVAYWTLDLSISELIWLVLLGFAGMLLDSFLGAFVQGKYHVDGVLQEEGNVDQLISGYHWIDNSMVNFLSVGIMVLVGYMAF